MSAVNLSTYVCVWSQSPQSCSLNSMSKLENVLFVQERERETIRRGVGEGKALSQGAARGNCISLAQARFLPSTKARLEGSEEELEARVSSTELTVRTAQRNVRCILTCPRKYEFVSTPLPGHFIG